MRPRCVRSITITPRFLNWGCLLNVSIIPLVKGSTSQKTCAVLTANGGLKRVAKMSAMGLLVRCAEGECEHSHGCSHPKALPPYTLETRFHEQYADQPQI